MSRLALALLVSASWAPTAAQAQADPQAQSSREVTDEQLTTAIEDARRAREEAEAAMAKADLVVKELETLRAARSTEHQIARASSSAEELDPIDFSGGLSIADKVKRLGIKCEDKDGKPIKNALNCFVWNGLGIKSPGQYSFANVSLQSAAESVDDTIEGKLSFNLRSYKEKTARAYYNKFTVGGYAAEGKGDAPAIIFDFDDLQSGSGVILGYEWGRFARLPAKNGDVPPVSLRTVAILSSGIDEARKECIESKVVDVSRAANIVNYQQAINECSSSKLWTWIAADKDRQKKYWGATAGKIYRAGETVPELSIGTEVRFGFREIGYLSAANRAAIGPVTTFDDLKAFNKANTFSSNPFSAKIYVTKALLKDEKFEGSRWLANQLRKRTSIGLIGSLTYLSDYEFPAGFAEQTLCLLNGNYSTCKDYNFDAPAKIEEFIPALGVNVLVPSYGWLPTDIGMGAKVTYRTDTERLGLDVPFYLMADSSGNLTGGLKLYFRSAGEYNDGRSIDEEKGVGFFISSKFNLLTGR
ncbi:MAG: hypothetical protein CL803_06855 [Citromicrobium sp.]|nr:hypothetical protein [Citromicrobium sp.]MAO96079.1 hypothetical protein [Citromicrobium sp.]MBT48206.1 hypothetical protein [Citromicrobium sp.]|tara:strand:+ start:2223 stop:3809 length:1587 start_codon:yes stop_codon:yes gene_type:complete